MYDTYPLLVCSVLTKVIISDKPILCNVRLIICNYIKNFIFFESFTSNLLLRSVKLQYYENLSPSYGNDLPLQAHLTRDVC